MIVETDVSPSATPQPTAAMESKQYYLSADLAPRLAAIDIGTNSVRLIIAEALRGGKYRILDDEKQTTRLGKNLSQTGHLDPEAVELSLQALRRMKQIADGYQVQELRAIATCAVREASDGPDFCRRVLEEVGIQIDVVSARKEAQLAFYGVLRGFDLEGKNVAVVDIGGGSTEIILASGKLIEEIFTTPLGAVRLTELFQTQQTLGQDEFNQLLDGIERRLRKHTKKLRFFPHSLIGSGGTFTALATMVMARKGQSGLPVQGYQVTRAEVRHLLDRLRKMSPKARRNLAGLSPDRADIIVAGIAIIDCVMGHFDINLLQVHTGGVRDGLLLTMVDDSLGSSSQQPPDRNLALEQFAANCGVDLPHTRHVAKLATSMFAQLQPLYALNANDQFLLEAAALLQDVGYLINYERHHKHSYHLILNSSLPGFRPEELELIANVARYHRGAKPKRKHENFGGLSRPDRLRVRQLAAILRLAGGCDRSHTQQVIDVEIAQRDDDLEMQLVAEELPEVDLWGVRQRGELFQDVFDTTLHFTWRDPAQSIAPAQSPADATSSADESPTEPEADADAELLRRRALKSSR